MHFTFIQRLSERVSLQKEREWGGEGMFLSVCLPIFVGARDCVHIPITFYLQIHTADTPYQLDLNIHLLVLYCTVLYCTKLLCTVLYCTFLYCDVVLCCVPSCSALHFSLILYFSKSKAIKQSKEQYYKTSVLTLDVRS